MLTDDRAVAPPMAVSAAGDSVIEAAGRAGRAIPPLWPLAASVAVNPFLGQTGESLAQAAARLARVAGARLTMPRGWYRDALASGVLTAADLQAALTTAGPLAPPLDLDQLRAAVHGREPEIRALDTIADLAAEASGIDWPGLLADRFSAWAAGYFDEGQALWRAPRDQTAYPAWRAVAARDLTPEIAGLAGFARYVTRTPETAAGALDRLALRLELPAAARETYFHQLLMSLGGWSQYARHRLWTAELDGSQDYCLIEFLAIRLVWEGALLDRYADRIAEPWTHIRACHAQPIAPTRDQRIDAVLQEAYERAAQRSLAAILTAPAVATDGREPDTRSKNQHKAAFAAASDLRPVLQVAFCIDVRSEVFRRALEGVDPHIQTLGFAGFFGVGTAHRRLASDVEECRLPVLLKPAIRSHATGPLDAGRDCELRLAARAARAWGRFKLAAVSSFAFVEASGPLYAGKLLRDALALRTAVRPHDPPPELEPALDGATRLAIVATVLRAMSLTRNFARLVILAGHGASAVNNPHASALQCGACGGHSGEVNARLLASLANDPEVRRGLAEQGMAIPADTVFLGALHDTTTDAVTVYRDCSLSPAQQKELAQAELHFASAGRIARGERALRLPHARDEASLARRALDWAEVRPEWGLTGCQAFIAAPRRRTTGRSLAGRVFLHDYEWEQDAGFRVLESILTAPVVVASWISLQYYGSTVAPETFGAGNKLLHNVVGGIGVAEGGGGLLRGGLPWQSVHDGERFMHLPLRLSVCIEAPPAAIADILRRHDGVRALFDHRWLHLFALDAEGRMAWRYQGGLNWSAEPR